MLSYGTGVRTPAENSALTEIIFNIFLATVITSTITKIAESKKGKKKKIKINHIVICSKDLNSQTTILTVKLRDSGPLARKKGKSTPQQQCIHHIPRNRAKREVRIQRKPFGISPRQSLSLLIPLLPEAPVHQLAREGSRRTKL